MVKNIHVVLKKNNEAREPGVMYIKMHALHYLRQFGTGIEINKIIKQKIE
jgi:DNA-directed RNA polymerase subunit F